MLRHLPTLREFYLLHHHGISDAGLANLASCEQLERVDLLGSSAGDGVIRALAGKTRLRHFKSGNLLTDSGLALLRQIPVFRAWRGGAPEMSLMSFEAQPNYLLLRGSISEAGLRNLAQLEGMFALNLDDSNLAPVALQNHASVHTHERKTARDIVLFGGLKKETVTAAVQFLES